MRHALPLAALALAALTLTGCQTVVQEGSLSPRRNIAGANLRTLVLLPPENVTADPAAGRALREYLASSLAAQGIRFRQTEESLMLASKKTAATETGLYPTLARLTGARYFLTGTIHEYRYISENGGTPAVGYTLRLVDARDGNTLWTGSAADSGGKSLSELCANSTRELAARIPILMRDETAPVRICLRTGKPAIYTPTEKPEIYEVDTVDGTLSYTTRIEHDSLPPQHSGMTSSARKVAIDPVSTEQEIKPPPAPTTPASIPQIIPAPVAPPRAERPIK